MNEKRFTLVTGASAGIGRELARIAAERGRNVILTARSEARLEALASSLEDEHGVTARAIACDLAEPEAPRRLFEQIEARNVLVDALVNNAGFGSHGAFHTVSRESQLALLRLNICALTELTHLVLAGMLARRDGRILNVASTAGFQPGPLMAVYYASKAYVLSFSEALAEELRGTGVTVTALCPGPTKTEFQARAGMEGARLAAVLDDARPVALAGYRAMERGQAVVIPGWANRALAFSVRLGPRALVRRIVNWLNSKATEEPTPPTGS